MNSYGKQDKFGREDEDKHDIFGSQQVLDNNAAPVPMVDSQLGQAQNEMISLDKRAITQVITEKEIAHALELLTKYKDGKSNLEARVVNGEQWYKMRHWEEIRKNDGHVYPEPASGWLFSSIVGKHADAMDNYPEPVVQPRERSDEESANTLQSIIPTLMEYNDFESTYSDNWWEKLKHGTAVYGVFWNSQKENGLGDIEIKSIDLLKIFWEPGIEDVQNSKNIFIVDLVETKVLDEMYPEHAGKMDGHSIDVKQYIYDDTVDTSEKSVVIDWYYKTQKNDGRTVLQYCKFVGDILLYASENDPVYADRGYYDHGMYPVVFDNLFPEKGTPVGFGYVNVCKDPQIYIDKLDSNILENSMMATKKRFFISNSTSIQEEEFLDWNQPLIHVEGEIGEERLREFVVQPLSPTFLNVKQMKIDEMKETSSSRDVNNGGGSNVTAASAIAALQEAGNKTSRDIITASYRSYRRIVRLVIELIRQFYDETRSFRITGKMPGSYDFIDLNNMNLKDQPIGMNSEGMELFRTPIFDIKIKAQKKSPFSRMEENERAKELYGLGFFNPERAQEALGALEMMDFEGIDKVKDQVRQGQTLINIVQQQQMQINQMMQALGILTGIPAEGQAPDKLGGGEPAQPAEPSGGGNKVTDGILQANTPMTSYGQRLAKRSVPDMNTNMNDL